MVISNEIRFCLYLVGLYVTFIYWGVLQEKLSKSSYSRDIDTDAAIKWNAPLVINALQTASGSLLAGLCRSLFISQSSENQIPLKVFWKPALSSVMASPLGYASLNYISFPLMVLSKSCKPIPVMMLGVFAYKRTFQWWKYVSVLILSSGIALFVFSQPSNKLDNGDGTEKQNMMAPAANIIIPLLDINVSIPIVLLGLSLVMANLGLDAVTNNEQDEIFTRFSAGPLQMMHYVDMWQTIFLLTALGCGYILEKESSQLFTAADAIWCSRDLRWDLLSFCICASLGKIMIFFVMKEFGSLTWITIGVTRKMFTILISVVLFGHPFNGHMWAGVGLVFIGLGLEVVCKYKYVSGEAANTSVNVKGGNAKKND